MKNSQVFYEVCDVSPDDDWEPMGFMFDSKTEAEKELRDKKAHVPTAFLVRVVMTRCEASDHDRTLKAV